MKSKMRLGILLSFLLSLVVVQFSATAETKDVLGLWSVDQTYKSSNKSALATEDLSSAKHYDEALNLNLNSNKMRSILAGTTSAKYSQDVHQEPIKSTTKRISIPLPDGSIIELMLLPDQILSGELAEKYSNIRTYKVLTNDKIFSGKVDVTPLGFHAMLQMLDGEIIFIDPLDREADKYVSYKKSAQKQSADRAFSCGVKEHDNHQEEKFGGQQSLARVVAGRTTESLLHYRIAVATTGEYAAKHGSTVTGAMSAIVTTLSRVNQILERDLGIHLDLVENNDLLINIDANSDPFTKKDLSDLLGQNQEFIDSVIGTENYDLGHLFAGSGGGIAAVAGLCNQYRKAQGVSGTSNPVNDSFDLDFVAHEIGHQLGATHTFNSSQGLCSGSTRSGKTAFEPGSGSSIMSYAGYCGLDNLQSNADAMYHIGSIEQISDFTSNGRGNICGTQKSFDNKPPIVDAGNDFTIPSRTPFELNGTAKDVDGDPLIYAWEQIDAGESSLEFDDKGDNALFRVRVPNNNKVRTFPQLQDILSQSTSRGEKLPEHERTMNFSFVAQDGMNVAQSDEMKINVARTGSRFALNLPKSQYTIGESYQILWNVADTDKSTVNCQNVDLFLSTDGGQNFKTVIEKGLSNKGDAWVVIPVTAKKTSAARFKLKCSDNVFFALSYRDFVITDKTTQVTYKHSDEDQPEANLKDTDLNAVVTNNEISTSSANTTNNSQGSSGGGLINYWLLLISCVLLMRKRLN
ncbi:reprolysin-like metallopeptidase [uncultured Cocleimonas sp.]|uniref:reprolysin-like metallopeptidase n=1 Tax=uncultured Cocleimonas sp. TaxID=1051587 RepID=UPI0026234A86|nr:zinc-dependent metalloprotease family protein [uncultured Cocleimonas sp.]